MNGLDIVGQVFWFGILATPIIAFFIVRNLKFSLGGKILLGIFITAFLAALFYFIAISIAFRDGLGPG